MLGYLSENTKNTPQSQSSLEQIYIRYIGEQGINKMRQFFEGENFREFLEKHKETLPGRSEDEIQFIKENGKFPSLTDLLQIKVKRLTKK